MGTVHREGGFRVMIFVDDHEPSHVHVFNADGVAVFHLGEGPDGVHLRSTRRMKDPDVRRAARLVAAHHARLLAKWEEIHG